ncbi:MAG: quinol:electron acceptor oxidoreductase subunit ActD [Planctomycetota bacterium]
MSQDKDKIVKGIVAEFETVDTLMDACRTVRDSGYKKTDAFTPFPVHGIDTALGIKPTILPWLCLFGGMAGTGTAIAMQWWMNGIDYKYIISGKPFVSFPAFMPVAFELTILFASFAAFFGMWALNKLPRYSNPMFTDPRFDRVTDDRFFLYIDATDEKYNFAEVEKLMGDAGSAYIQPVVEDDSPKQVPRFIFMVWMLVAGLSAIPLLAVLKMRLTRSELPRFHVFFDMDFSPAKDAQHATTLFADSRTMRDDVEGTIYRGQYSEEIVSGKKVAASATVDDLRFVSRFDDEALSAAGGDRDPGGLSDEAKVELDADKKDPDNKESDQKDSAGSDAGNAGSASPDSGDAGAQPPIPDDQWLSEIPLTVDRAFIEKGKEQFNIYCAVCHGRNGSGQGLVHERARKILSQWWVPPSSLHQKSLYRDKYPDGKMFGTITYGVRKMPGYAAQIKVQDRWAIVAYIRALQETRRGSLDDVPADLRADIESAKLEAEARLKEEAEKQKKKDNATEAQK